MCDMPQVTPMVPKAAASLLPVITMKIFGRKNQEGVLIKAPDQKLECEEKWSLQLLHESTKKLQMLLENVQMNF